MAASCARRLALLILLALCWAAPAGAQDPVRRRGGTPTGQHAPAQEAALEERLQAVVELIYRSRLLEAARAADEARRMAPQDPRVHIMEARILRESFPDQSSTGENLEGFSGPIHAQLDRAIELCDSLLERDDRLAAAYLYRGWAHLFAAQMHTLCDELWSAGRHAKSGKNDLDRALERDPGNPDAQGILGTYLYFADVLPRVVKLARTLVGIPGGDRRLGLEMMHASAAGDGYNRLDARGLLGAIALGFEGDFTGSTRIFESMLHDYPDNPRLLEPLAVLDLIHPESCSLERTARIARMYAEDPEDWYRQLSQRLVFYQALLESLLGRIDAARDHLESVRRCGPTQPDWFPGDVVICLAEMHLLVGERDRALTLYPGAERHEKLAERLRLVNDADAAATSEEAGAFRRAQEAARDLYAGDLDGARHRLATVGDDPAALFYRGELARLAGDASEATERFQQLAARTLPRRWRLYKTLAFSRLAELQGAAGAPGEAEKTLGRGLEFDADRDLFRHVLRARRRHFDLLASGDDRIPAAAGSGIATPQAPGP